MTRPKLTLKNMILHARKICIHCKWVRYYCRLAGIPLRGWLHDLSKYSPAEFFESSRYYVGTSSPINEAKRIQGISYAWLHHRGRNRHHHLYWYDNIEEGGYCHLIPKKDFTELVCDFLGAARAYNENEFSYHKELIWWYKKRDTLKMNEKNKIMLDDIFSTLEYNARRANINEMTPEENIKNNLIGKIWDKYSVEENN